MKVVILNFSLLIFRLTMGGEGTGLCDRFASGVLVYSADGVFLVKEKEKGD